VINIIRKNSERGASMVEFAMVFPLFMLLVFGSLEASAAFYARTTVGLATADSARAASISVYNSTSDKDVIEEITELTDLTFGVDVERIVIYKATNFDSEPSASCIAGAAGPDCAVYEPSDFELGICGAGSWCPTDRQTDDLIGVWVQSRFDGMSGISPLEFMWQDKAVTIVEPKL